MMGDSASFTAWLVTAGLVSFILFITILPKWVSNLCHGPIRPTPSLPYIFYMPRYVLINGVPGMLALGLLGCYVDDRRIGVALLCFVVLFVIIFVKALIKPRKILTISTDGLQASFTSTWKVERHFIAWSEIIDILADDVAAGRTAIGRIRIELRTGEHLDCAVGLRYRAREELVGWLQEYLSRYGKSAKQPKA